MTRRSFCFLFGAGVAGLALPNAKLYPVNGISIAVTFSKIAAAQEAYYKTTIEPVILDLEREICRQLYDPLILARA